MHDEIDFVHVQLCGFYLRIPLLPKFLIGRAGFSSFHCSQNITRKTWVLYFYNKSIILCYVNKCSFKVGVPNVIVLSIAGFYVEFSGIARCEFSERTTSEIECIMFSEFSC